MPARNTLLVVDDDFLILGLWRRVVNRLSTTLPIELACFNTGQDAQDFVRNHGEQIFGAFIDMEIGTESGFDVLAAVEPFCPHTTFVLFTGSGLSEDDIAETGFSGVMEKTIHHTTLLDAVTKMYQSHLADLK
jgi:DNA-binding NtrC family response regulator